MRTALSAVRRRLRIPLGGIVGLALVAVEDPKAVPVIPVPRRGVPVSLTLSAEATAALRRLCLETGRTRAGIVIGVLAGAGYG